MKQLLLAALLLTSAILPAQNVSYRYDAAGNRTERVIVLSSPPKSPAETSAPTSVNDLISGCGIKIYPNPTRGMLSVEIGSYSGEMQAEFQLMDMSGKTLNRQKAGSATTYFDMSAYSKGIYLLRIRIDDETVTWKVIRE